MNVLNQNGRSNKDVKAEIMQAKTAFTKEKKNQC